jgi:hypothetical protein
MALNFDGGKHYSFINTKSLYEVLRGIKFLAVPDPAHQINPQSVFERPHLLHLLHLTTITTPTGKEKEKEKKA